MGLLFLLQGVLACLHDDSIPAATDFLEFQEDIQEILFLEKVESEDGYEASLHHSIDHDSSL